MTSPKMGKMATLLLLALPAAAPAADRPANANSAQVRTSPELPPFLDVFLAQHDVKVVTQPVQWVSAVGNHQGLLVRDDTGERLPALLLIEYGPTSNFAKRSSLELAEIGYAVLLVQLKGSRLGEGGSDGHKRDEKAHREQALAQLAAAVRWLRRRADVFPDRIGALGFKVAARWALETAGAGGLQAAVLCDPPLPLAIAADVPASLRRSAVFVVYPTADSGFLDGEHLSRLKRRFEGAGVEHRVLELNAAKKGFMNQARDDAFHAELADRAWFEIYEFLGKHVEDAPLKALLAARQNFGGGPPLGRVASIADLMQAVNTPTGVRGLLAQSLAQEPDSAKNWQHVRARAALMTDAAQFLFPLEPPKGNLSTWRRHVDSYRDAAAAITDAADRHDYPASRQALNQLSTTCGRCHLDHR